MTDIVTITTERPASLPHRLWKALWKPTRTTSLSGFRPGKNALLTERDGRELAITMLRQARDVGPNAAYIKAEFRNGAPQNNFVLGYLWALREANDAKIEAGFCAVLSAVLANAMVDGKLSEEFYENINLTRTCALEPAAGVGLLKKVA